MHVGIDCTDFCFFLFVIFCTFQLNSWEVLFTLDDFLNS